jgi:hypothetical protein
VSSESQTRLLLVAEDDGHPFLTNLGVLDGTAAMSVVCIWTRTAGTVLVEMQMKATRGSCSCGRQ